MAREYRAQRRQKLCQPFWSRQHRYSGFPFRKWNGRAYRLSLRRELRAIRIEILAICQKYGVSSWEGMNESIIEDKIEEGKVLDDFQRVDHLTAKAKQIRVFLDRL